MWAEYGHLQPHTLLPPLPSLTSPASADFGAVLATTFGFGMADVEGPLSGCGTMSLGPLYPQHQLGHHQAPAPHTCMWNAPGPAAGQQYYGTGMQHAQPQYQQQYQGQYQHQTQYQHHQPHLGVHHDVEAFISFTGAGYNFGPGAATQPG